MWILPLVGYIGSIVGFCFLTLAIGMITLLLLRPAPAPAGPPEGTKWYGVQTVANTSRAASGLYYLSELVEEHTVIAKRFLTRLIYSIMGLQLLLYIVDRFPFFLTLLSIVSHFIYLGNMRRFPYVKLTDPLFLTSCGEFGSWAFFGMEDAMF